MGRLVDGKWFDDDASASAKSESGAFVRAASAFGDWVRKDGSTPFPPARDRYHLYVSAACPWAHRARVFRVIKGLQDVVSESGVEAVMTEGGWRFSDDYPDPLHDDTVQLYQVYQRADPQYSGRVTVPVLWDKEQGTIVSNESSEIIRMFNSEFDELSGNDTDYYPAELREAIDALNERVYHCINNGVYKAGFASSQHAYDAAVGELFDALDELETRLADGPFLLGQRCTEADWRLYTTLLRFDPVYHGHFKCNRRRLRDYPRLLDLTRRLHETPGVAQLWDPRYTMRHYYGSHLSINPTGIVPTGPAAHLGEEPNPG